MSHLSTPTFHIVMVLKPVGPNSTLDRSYIHSLMNSVTYLIILTRNTLTLNDENLQVQRTAMGTRMALSYANIS